MQDRAIDDDGEPGAGPQHFTEAEPIIAELAEIVKAWGGSPPTVVVRTCARDSRRRMGGADLACLRTSPTPDQLHMMNRGLR
jgi:hypothetical protein